MSQTKNVLVHTKVQETWMSFSMHINSYQPNNFKHWTSSSSSLSSSAPWWPWWLTLSSQSSCNSATERRSLFAGQILTKKNWPRERTRQRSSVWNWYLVLISLCSPSWSLSAVITTIMTIVVIIIITLSLYLTAL